MVLKFISKSENETIAIGEAIGKKIKPNTLIYLKGDLAAGKTTFTKGLGKGIGVKSVINSPTFTILKIYEGRMNLYHIDAYRLEGISYDLGFDELINDDGVVVVEWFEYIESLLGKASIYVDFNRIDETTRVITVDLNGYDFKVDYKEM